MNAHAIEQMMVRELSKVYVTFEPETGRIIHVPTAKAKPAMLALPLPSTVPFPPRTSTQAPRLADIRKIVCDLSGLDAGRLTLRGKAPNIALARQVYCWIALKTTEHSASMIAKSIGRHHTTVLHARDVISDRVREGKCPLAVLALKAVRGTA